MANAPGELVQLLSTLQHADHCSRRACRAEFGVQMGLCAEVCDCWLSRALELARSQAELLRSVREVIEASRCIRHWHDSGRDNEGMVVSSKHVRLLWTALENYDSALSEAPTEQPPELPNGGCDCDIPPLEGAGQHAVDCSIFKVEVPMQPGVAMAPTHPELEWVCGLCGRHHVSLNVLAHHDRQCGNNAVLCPKGSGMAREFDEARAGAPSAPVLPDALKALEEWLRKPLNSVGLIARSDSEYRIVLDHDWRRYPGSGPTVAAAILAALEASK